MWLPNNQNHTLQAILRPEFTRIPQEQGKTMDKDTDNNQSSQNTANSALFLEEVNKHLLSPRVVGTDHVKQLHVFYDENQPLGCLTATWYDDAQDKLVHAGVVFLTNEITNPQELAKMLTRLASEIWATQETVPTE